MNRITVGITAYNCKQALFRTLMVLEADRRLFGEPKRIIVVDQCSTDKTQSIMRMKDSVEYVRFEKTMSASVARNFIADASTSKYTMFLDGDVVPRAGSASALANWLDAHGDFDVLGFSSLMAYGHENMNDYPPLPVILDSNVVVMDRRCDDYPHSLQHYGMYKRETAVEYRNPEFPPFRDAGWGAEDHLTGLCMAECGVKIGVVGGLSFTHLTDWFSYEASEGVDCKQRTSMPRFFCAHDVLPRNGPALKELFKLKELPRVEARCSFVGDARKVELFKRTLRLYFPFVDLVEGGDIVFFIDCKGSTQVGRSYEIGKGEPGDTVDFCRAFFEPEDDSEDFQARKDMRCYAETAWLEPLVPLFALR